MRWLLLGGSGQVGEAFRALPLPGNVEIATPNRAELDLADPCAIATAIAAAPWSAVINLAAYTEVDRAEREAPAAFAINAEAPARLAAETSRIGIPFIHISTDYVFNGRKGTPYVEEDVPIPLNVYGQSKLAGECAVRAANMRHVILRTSWVYSPHRKNFVLTILRLAAERDRLAMVDDQRGCPTAASDIAMACCNIAMRCSGEPESAPYGTYHFAGAGEATWFEFARTIVALAADRLGRHPQVVPIGTDEYPTAAVRPSDTRLDCTAVVRAFGLKLRPWEQALAETMSLIFKRTDAP